MGDIPEHLRRHKRGLQEEVMSAAKKEFIMGTIVMVVGFFAILGLFAMAAL